jgi:SAM-dependent methyltransferase
MSDTSLIYRSAFGYELVMRALYGRHYDERMRAVAAEVPHGSSVLELCCGPGTLYKRYLRPRTSVYIGLDVNEHFVHTLRAEGIDARQVDLKTSSDPLPRADVALMQASLYHFLPHAERIVDRMLGAALRRVIISEPIRNLTSSEHPLVRRLSGRASDPGVGGSEARFTEDTLDELMERCSHQVMRSFLIPGGREKVYVLRSG